MIATFVFVLIMLAIVGVPVGLLVLRDRLHRDRQGLPTSGTPWVTLSAPSKYGPPVNYVAVASPEERGQRRFRRRYDSWLKTQPISAMTQGSERVEPALRKAYPNAATPVALQGLGSCYIHGYHMGQIAKQVGVGEPSRVSHDVLVVMTRLAERQHALIRRLPGGSVVTSSDMIAAAYQGLHAALADS